MVDDIKLNKEKRDAYMIKWIRENAIREEGKEEGREVGREEGINLIAALIENVKKSGTNQRWIGFLTQIGPI